MIGDGLLERLLEARTVIREKMVDNHVNASGKTSDSLSVARVGDHFIMSFDADYDVSTLEHGYIGKAPIDIIYEWSIVKGINMDEVNRARFAYLTSKKIEREGTERYRNNIDIYTEECNNVIKEAGSIIYTEVSEYIKRLINK